MSEVIHGDCVEVMQRMVDESIDLTVTSPPYDNMRTYKGYDFDFGTSILFCSCGDVDECVSLALC